MTNALAKRKSDALARIDETARECSMVSLAAIPPMQRAAALAVGVNQIRDLVTPEIVSDFMSLQNTPLGFLTDRRGEGYPSDVVKECVIEAVLNGVDVVGNEFNIIGGRCYITKNGMKHKLRDYPGFADLKVTPDVPAMKNGGAVVRMRAEWTLNGVHDSIDREIPVKVNNGQGVDAILGKAHRKLYAAIFEQITGSVVSDGEVEVFVDQDGNEIVGARRRLARSPLNDELAADPEPEPNHPESPDSSPTTNFERCMAATGLPDADARNVVQNYISTNPVPLDDDGGPAEEAMVMLLRVFRDMREEREAALFNN